jgi:eukaryotic-like serine/threonine-protein kinase
MRTPVVHPRWRRRLRCCHDRRIVDASSTSQAPGRGGDPYANDELCPDDAALVELLAGRLDDIGRRALHAHVDRCPRCRDLLAHLARFTAADPHAHARASAAIEQAVTVASGSHDAAGRRTIASGTRIGHFAIVAEIGQGGMGTVFSAHDTRLGRRVALKLVTVAGTGGPAAESSQRLQREAQAMAAISHPNVVTVHEVGSFGAEVFVAMELVDGDTLAGWLAVPRSWSEIVRTFVAAGRGLAAAHDAGLVHRDFKPHNVLVTERGRVCVTDFGLVQAGPWISADRPAGEITLDDRAMTLSETGQVMGTLRYMPPEQLRGEPTDARADQFAFCVALFEALYRQHPFGDGAHAWVVAARDGTPPARVDTGAAPRQIHRAIVRGLAADRQLRFPSMAALLDQLEAGLGRRRRFALAIGGGAIVGLAAFAGFAAGHPTPRACERSGDTSFGASWRDPARHEAVERASAVGTLDPQSWPRIAARLDAYVERGERLRAEVCERIDAQQGSERALAERTLACLEMHDDVLTAVIELVGSERESGAIEPLDVIYGLAPTDACAEVSARASIAAPPPVAAEDEVRSIRRRVAGASALGWGGRPEQAIASLQTMLGEAEQLGYPPLLAEIHHAVGIASEATDVPAAIASLRSAHAEALRAGADVAVVETMTSLASLLADRGEAPEQAAWMVEEIEAWRARLGLRETPELHSVRATIARARGELDDAIAWGIRMVELSEREHASPSILVTAHANLGAMFAERHELARAREHATRALELSEAAYGPMHRRTLRCRTNLVGLAYMLGDPADAEAMGLELLAAYEATGIAELPEGAVTLTMLGMIARAQGRYDAAQGYDTRALEIRIRVFGELHRLVVESREKLALDELGAGEPAAAVAQLRRAVAMRLELHPATHPAIAQARIELSRALTAAGEPREADLEARAALAQLEASFASDDARLYGPLLYAGIAAIGVDDFDRALVELEHAASLAAATAMTPLDWAELELATARAQARGDRHSPRARELVTRARARLTGADPAETKLIAEIEQWLAEPAPRSSSPATR